MGKIQSLLDSVKNMVESHKQSNPMVIIVPQYHNLPVVSQVPVVNQGHQPWLPQPGLTAVSGSERNPRKKIRRGRKPGETKNQRVNSELTNFLYANANGYRSKKESIN